MKIIYKNNNFLILFDIKDLNFQELMTGYAITSITVDLFIIIIIIIITLINLVITIIIIIIIILT